MIWNKKKDGAENPGAETPAAQTTKAPVLFLQKNWKWLVPGVCVVIAGGVFLLKPKSASTTAVDPSYLEASPEVRDVSNTLSGTGTLNPANTYTVKSLVEGKVLTGEFEEGDVLDEGTVLYTLDSSDASTNFEKAEIAMQQAQRSYDKVVDRQYVRAEVDGTVSTLKVAKGDEVTSGQEVAIIRDSSKMLLTLEFPAADAANFSVGQTAQVTLDGTFEQFKAYVDAHKDENPSCLCFTGEAEKLGVPCVEYGREGDGADQAKHIFRSLRALDEQGDSVVYARFPQKDGLSMAVYNRLIRAAAFRVIKL
mgnify:CR=1 FL=1